MIGKKIKKNIKHKIIEIKIMEKKGIIEWTLSKDVVEHMLRKKISDDEFLLFAEHFKSNFEAQFEDTLDWQISDWEEVKTWDLK